MESVTQMEEHLSRVLGPRANELARQSGFIRRKRQIEGASFVQGLIFGWLHTPDARLEQLSQALGRAETPISAPGLSQRFSSRAVDFLQAVFEELVQLSVEIESAERSLLSRFSAVIVEDSTQISLPDELSEDWPGCGNGSKHEQASLKLHVQWDLLSGRLRGPVLSEGKLSDHRSPLREDPEGIPAGAVYVADNGYFDLAWLQAHTQQGRYALTRPRSTTAFFDLLGSRLDLCEIGPQQVGASLDKPVLVGGQVRWQARLIMVRVPPEVAEQRQERIQRTAQRHSRQADPHQLALAHWTILITNVPFEKLSTAQVVIIQRARWQIERLFRLWKEGGFLDEWRSKKPERILCELYGKLMGLLIQHWLLQETCWSDPRRSLVKASKVIRDCAWDVLAVVRKRSSLLEVIQQMQRVMGSTCRINQRQKFPSTAQLLQEQAADP